MGGPIDASGRVVAGHLGLEEHRRKEVDRERAEQARLFYVACTRAKDRLYLVYPTIADERYLMGVIQRPSRFLKELDKATYEEATVTYGDPGPKSPFDDDSQDIPEET